MRWVMRTVNQKRYEMVCVYVNEIVDMNGAVKRYLDTKQTVPKKIRLILHFHKTKGATSASEYSSINITLQFGRLGTHISMVILDRENKEIVYEDLLGWPPPVDLMDEVKPLYESLFQEEITSIDIIECHQSHYASQGHICSRSCSLYYPLQKDSNIYGVEAAKMLSVACLHPAFLSRIVISQCNDAEHDSNLFLENPSRCGKYLQQVILAWISEGCISLKYLLPSAVLNGNKTLDAFEQTVESEENVDVELAEL